MTKDAFLESKYGILQLLTPEQHGLVHILGKHSGYEAAATGYSKPMECAKIGCDWVPCRFGCGEEEQNNNDSSATFHPPPHILPNCALYLVLKVQSTMPAGDHELALCQVTHTCRMDTTTGRLVAVDPQMAALDETNVLYTRQLRQMGIL
jgi:flavin reductase (DIM6/NTAB) family NADH-FMN oxidoreductase RutF